ncbi:MAG: FG-GAP-like repeat-containing protein [Tannerella sp.]|jgi:uncharacterized repeat protein (TIGR01451 family)/uncharacterized repeat protein (TIGR02543 family)|nr:FG-GAP-like repeat-containing protein [Tannerella sp.]
MSQLQTAPDFSIDANTALNDDGIDLNAIKSGGYINLSHADFKLDASGNLNVKVKVNNVTPTKDDATLIGWIDFNRNGLFDGASEASSTVTVAAGSSSSTATLTWAGANTLLRNGTTYMRLRITTDKMDNTQPTGLFFNGEVEDYRLDFNILEISKKAVSSNKVNNTHADTGDTITYNIQLINNMPAAIININLFDPVPEGAVYVQNSAVAGNTAVTSTQPQNIVIGGQNRSSVVWPSFNLAAGTTSDVFSFKAIVTDKPFGSDSISNIAYAIYNGDTIVTDTAKIKVNIIRAYDDHAGTFKDETINIPVLDNDYFVPSCNVVPMKTMGPVNGTASVNGNGEIVYTPAAGFLGKDSLKYTITCSGITEEAIVYLTVYELPDNIVEPDCRTTPERKEWNIRLNQQVGNVATITPFVVGDLNEDGFPDIVAYGSNSYSSIKIFWGPDFSSVKEITGVSANLYTTLAIGRIKVSDTPSETYESLIFYRSGTTLRALRPDGTSPWTSNPTSSYPGMIGLADFNGDGWTEVYIGNQIYDAATGKLLCNGGTSENSGTTMLVLSNEAQPAAIDILGDANLELVAGNKIYEVDIDRNTATPKSLKLISSVTPPASCPNDGITVVADFDNDGKLEVLVRRRQTNSSTTTQNIHLYLWSPHTGTATGTLLAATTDNHKYFGIPFAGDIDGDGRPEIVTLGSNGIYQTQSGFKARRYSENTGTFDLLWDHNHIDQSGATGMTLFDFNNDEISEIVYRDESLLRIINASGKSHITGIDTIGFYVIDSFISYSETFIEYPVVVDLYGNQSAAILVTSDLGGPRPSGYNGNATIDIYTSDPSVPWVPARKVWNQYAYNAVNVNKDITIPKNPLNIATVFPGIDGVLGTPDDIRPYNNFLQQQPIVDSYGVSVFLSPDAMPIQSLTSSTVIGDSVSITVAIVNKGDAAIGSPVYVTLYKESISGANKIVTGSLDGYINPNDTGYITVSIADITPFLPMVNIIIRINDDGASFTYQPECDDTNNEMTYLNPALALMMKKNATLNGTPDNGSLPNPVSVLFGEEIEYKITAVNANLNAGSLLIRDTLPAYLYFVNGSESSSANFSLATTGSPTRDIVTWSFTGVSSMAETTVIFKASPESGACASQPLFTNRAWITSSDTIHVPTSNRTFHQGAGIGVATFSAGFGGNIYNAAEQALDYRTTPRSGIVIVPDKGYLFTGWSHHDYISLRGTIIHAQEGIMVYDTITVYGNVELHANFELEQYPVNYYLNGSENPENNPSVYTIKSETILLGAPEKTGDVFIGWTGSNGEEPQENVLISTGSTGELVFYANFLYSGKEVADNETDNKDKIWAVKDELFIRTPKTDAIVRIYSTEGALQKQQTIPVGETIIRLQKGIYVVSLNNNTGQKIIIE